MSVPSRQLSGGGSVTGRYSVGLPVTFSDPGAPPTGVLDACGLDSSTATDTSVYVPGEITVTYSGTIPMAIPVAAGDITALSVRRVDQAVGGNDGSWICSGPVSGNDTVLTYNLSPGQSITRPIWVLLTEVLTNDAPNFVPSQHFDIAFTGSGIGTPGPGIGATINSATGPHAMSCDEDGAEPRRTSLTRRFRCLERRRSLFQIALAQPAVLCRPPSSPLAPSDFTSRM